MKKLYIAVTLLILISATAFGQKSKSFYNTSYKSRNSGSFGRSTGLLTFSYGFPNLPVSGYSYIGDNRIGFGPVYAKYEHAIMDEVGIGGQMAFSVGRYKYGNNEHERIRSVHFAALGYYHFNKLIPVRQLDVYAGAGLAFRRRAVSYTDDLYFDDTQEDVDIALKVGLRYYPKNNVGLYAEAGYDHMSDVNLGVSFRFK